MKRLLAHYWPELLITIAVWIVIGREMGMAAFLLTIILSMLEITLSADNAVVNSRVLMRLSVFWQRVFLTVGIIFAVFIVRFVLPIVMVAIATGLGVSEAYHLAISNPEAYGDKLHDVAPLIDGFGGIFLLMVALFFFVDHQRDRRHHWLRWPEGLASRLARLPFAKLAVVLFVYGSIMLLLPPSAPRGPVAIAMLIGVLLYSLLYGITEFMEHLNDGKSSAKHVTGWAAFSLFMYLQVLDAGFSLDGVVGAFALTNNIVIIMAGLGIGALWVRTMTVYMVRHDTLMKYQFLESGAHWAILALATIMLLKLFHIELPELVIGSISLIFVAGAVIHSMRINNIKKVLTKKC